MADPTTCALCQRETQHVLYADQALRVVLVTDADYPGFCRVIWNAHVAEMTDLAPAQSAHLMRVVFAVEAALRAVLRPDKINLASLGNQVPHLHWHVIARFVDDAHFPQPIWGVRQREPDPARLRERMVRCAESGALTAAIQARLAP